MPVRILDSMNEDPITRLLLPPSNETGEEMTMRLAKEAEARRISDEIDERIQLEREALKHQNVLKMLLLGQSESGKSTTLKNIQRMQAPDVWKRERTAWRTVIQLNLVRAVNLILDAVAAELSGVAETSLSYDIAMSSSPPTHDHGEDDFDTSGHSSLDFSASAPIPLSDRYNALRLQFAPLRRVEADLKMALGAAADEVTEASGHSNMVATPFDALSRPGTASSRKREFYVRSHETWKSIVNDTKTVTPRGSPTAANSSDVIAAFRSDMKILWRDDTVRQVLKRRKVTLEDSAEYFLENIDRIATRNYEPTDDDIIRARLRTIGVQEYRIPFHRSKVPVTQKTKDVLGKEWRIYDVGGARSMRAAWLPFFDDAQSILFLAPISCFDERLAEDQSVNRLKDSFILWKSIVGSKILSKCIIILFLNKCDLLDKKLKSGVKVNKYIPRYADRENTKDAFGRYIREKFRDYMNEYSPERRPFYGYLTSVVDTRATSATLMSIQDGILQSHLEKGMML